MRSQGRQGKIGFGYVFRPVVRVDRVNGERLREKVVWPMLREYAFEISIPRLMTFASPARSCAAQLAVSLSRFSYS